jgi:hypothetical protein
MSTNFERTESGELRIKFTTQEAQVLINLLEQLLELLGEPLIAEPDPLFNLLGITGNETPPDDPVLRRLLPNAYEDEKEASEFRRYTDQPLDRSTIELKIKADEMAAWLSSLNDLRLALAVRLGIGENLDGGDGSQVKARYELATESDPMKAVYAVYSWLGWLQQSLLEAIE